jgi:hypothetical protein
MQPMQSVATRPSDGGTKRHLRLNPLAGGHSGPEFMTVWLVLLFVGIEPTPRGPTMEELAVVITTFCFWSFIAFTASLLYRI